MRTWWTGRRNGDVEALSFAGFIVFASFLNFISAANRSCAPKSRGNLHCTKGGERYLLVRFSS